MTILTAEQVADLAYAAGFRGDALATITAIAKPESGLGLPAPGWADTATLGDTKLETAKWGPSVGIWQVRSLKAELGTGRSRDKAALLASPAKQARSAWEISRGGTRFTDWSTYKDGKFRAYLALATAAARKRDVGPWPGETADRGLPAPGSVSGGGAPGGDLVAPTDAAGGAARSEDVVIPAGDLPLLWRPPRSLADLRIARPAGSLDLAAYVTGGDVELSLEQTSELTLELLNPGRELLGSGRGIIALRHRVDWGDLSFVVAAEATGGGTTGPRATVTCRDRGVEALKLTNVTANGKADGEARGVSVSGKNLSPTEYAQLQAEAVGLTFVGEGSPRRTDIAPERDEASGIYESPWEVVNRLAGELGYLAFVAGGALHFGRPRWLVSYATEVKVGVDGAWGDEALDALEEPVYRDTVDSFEGATLSVVLPRWRGEQLRPGLRMVTKGIYGMGTSVWLITRVRWPIDAGQGPVDVDAVIPVDPPVRAKEGPAEAPADDPMAGMVVTSTGNASTFRPTNVTYAPGQRISGSQRAALFGPPGDTSRITTYRTPWGMTVSVHRDVLDRFRQACENAASRSTWRPRRIDSYNKRAIRGRPGEWSYHSWALAWDFFSSAPGVAPPGGVWAATSAPDSTFRAEFAKLGFALGADFRTRPDYPHIEWASAPPPSPSARVT